MAVEPLPVATMTVSGGGGGLFLLREPYRCFFGRILLLGCYRGANSLWTYIFVWRDMAAIIIRLHFCWILCAAAAALLYLSVAEMNGRARESLGCIRGRGENNAVFGADGAEIGTEFSYFVGIGSDENGNFHIKLNINPIPTRLLMMKFIS